MRYCSTFNPAIGDSLKVWNARDFIADATLARYVHPWTARPCAIPGKGFIPPQAVRLIRFFGLYSSRSPPPLPSLGPPAVRHGRD